MIEITIEKVLRKPYKIKGDWFVKVLINYWDVQEEKLIKRQSKDEINSLRRGYKWVL